MRSGSLTAMPVRFIPKSIPMSLSIDCKYNNFFGAFMSNDNKTERKPKIFLLSLTDAKTHEQLWVRPFRMRQAVAIGVSALVLVIALVFVLIAFTPVKTFIPGYPDASTTRRARQNAVRIDSLEREILHWELYVENLRRVVAGEEPLKLDSLIIQKGRGLKEEVSIDPELDSLLRARLRALDNWEGEE